MLQIINNYTEVQKSNIFFLFTNKFDAEKLTFLNLWENILSKIESLFEKQKNISLKIYLGRDDFEEVILFFYLDRKQDIHHFLWENIDKIPEKITFEYHKDNILLDSIILWKYDYSEYKQEKKELEINLLCPEIYKKNLLERLSTLKNITDARDIVNKPFLW